MRKIDKSKIPSKNYEDWIKSLEGADHPKYNSSKNKYYTDIKMSLLHCQKGLCAYTEELLCDPKYIGLESWDDKKYIHKLDKNDKNSIRGDLEHFDESLKPKFAFLWSNFFIVNTHNNCRIKGSKPIKKILKPDSESYDPYKYLEFFIDKDADIYIFIPNRNLSEEEQKDVKKMIDTLGLNCIEYQRKRQIKEWIDQHNIGLSVEPYQYFTAWKITLESL
jgi:hypothetical protein